MPSTAETRETTGDNDPKESSIIEPREAARAAGLRYVSDTRPGITRQAKGDGFFYRDPSGEPVRDEAVLERIRSLAIPPAYTDVWICPYANGHIQATGRDAKGRKQYRYHPRWRETRDATKYEHMEEFAAALPALRARVEADLQRKELCREKVLATVVRLLETTLIRVGNDDYAKENGSFGLTTLRNRHVKVEGGTMRFAFKGKSGKTWKLGLQDRRIARVVKACQDLPGQELFAWPAEDGTMHDVTSGDVNDYLREVTGRDITAKDFRTWSGTVMAALALREFEAFDSQTAAKKNVRAAIEHVASRLGNTPTVCRKCYVHPDVIEGYMAGQLVLEMAERAEQELREELEQLRPEEAAVLALLARLKAGKGSAVPEKAKRAAGKAVRRGKAKLAEAVAAAA
ncbi:DNA topoisomerase IB [Pararoseomonas indoligenes]|uniref:DNA topoisomerase IB n=1 Tax=Roseomonas indoligenes TaxID=2820811 RepID=A0A940S4V9_9PROT|nr:DNA topoisomerase IB [Pararoseomonas indoligenes]MBP0492389.1 DNA topoisomerase IB [Pararoseomonas indoligenes]